MSQQIKGDALSAVASSLGLTGPGEQVTEFQDGILDQHIDVAPLIRRGRTQAATDGLYIGVMENVHGAADSQVSVIAPYLVPVGAIGPYPAIMPESFDVWILGASTQRTTGSGTMTASLAMRFGAPKMGFGIDEAGLSVAPVNVQIILAFWDALITENTTFGLLNGARGPYKKIGIRMPRDAASDLVFRTTSSAIATFHLNLVLGVFPVGLGQDAIV